MRKHNKKKVGILTIYLLLLCFTGSITFDNVIAFDSSISQSNPTLNYEMENWWLTDMELLSGTSTGASAKPSIAIDSDDNIHVVWADSTNDLVSSGSDIDIFYRFYNPLTETWSVEELVSSESTGYSMDPCLDVDSSGNIHVIWYDQTDYLSSGTDADIFYKMRDPVGVWTTTSVLTPLSTNYVDNPDLSIDSEDNIHVVYEDDTDMLSAGTDEDIFYLWYDNSLSLWSASYLVSSESTSDSTKACIAIDPLSDLPYITWNDGTNLLSSGTDSDIFCKSYDHSSSSFSSLTVVSTESDGQSYSPDIAINNRGVPYVTWYDYDNMLGSGSDGDIFQKYFDSITSQWVGIELVSLESSGNSASPRCIIDKEDRLFIFWDDYTDILGAGTDLDLFFRFKNPSVGSWSDLRLLTEESTNFVESLSLAVDSQGFVSCVWSDYDNLLSSGIDQDLYYKKFVGTPGAPVLYAIFPNPSSESDITLNWVDNPQVSSYSLYRSTTPFTSAVLGSISPLVTLSSNTYTDSLSEHGVYYYGVVANNEYGDSGLSNVEIVQFSGGKFFSFFSSISALEMLTIAGIILASQVIISVIISSLFKGRNKVEKKKGAAKKKK